MQRWRGRRRGRLEVPNDALRQIGIPDPYVTTQAALCGKIFPTSLGKILHEFHFPTDERRQPCVSFFQAEHLVQCWAAEVGIHQQD